MPGMWDPHFHPLNVYQGSQFNQVWAAMFAYGFTSVQSVAGPVYPSTEIREALEAGNLIGPRLLHVVAAAGRQSHARTAWRATCATRRSPISRSREVQGRRHRLDQVVRARRRFPVDGRFAEAAQRDGHPERHAPAVSRLLDRHRRGSRTCRRRSAWATAGPSRRRRRVPGRERAARPRATCTSWRRSARSLVAGQRPILLSDDRFNVLMPIPYVSNLLAQTPADARAAREDQDRHGRRCKVRSGGRAVRASAPTRRSIRRASRTTRA